MPSSQFNELSTADAGEVARTVLTTKNMTSDDLRAALANALSRIAALEKVWNDVGEALQWFSEQVAKKGY